MYSENKESNDASKLISKLLIPLTGSVVGMLVANGVAVGARVGVLVANGIAVSARVAVLVANGVAVGARVAVLGTGMGVV